MKPVWSKQIIFEILKGILSTFQTFFVSLKKIKNCIYSEFSSDGEWNSENAKLCSPAGEQGQKIGWTYLTFFRPKSTPSPHWTQKMVFQKIFFLTTIAPCHQMPVPELWMRKRKFCSSRHTHSQITFVEEATELHSMLDFYLKLFYIASRWKAAPFANPYDFSYPRSWNQHSMIHRTLETMG